MTLKAHKHCYAAGCANAAKYVVHPLDVPEPMFEPHRCRRVCQDHLRPALDEVMENGVVGVAGIT